MINLITNAKKSIKIVSPYFSPTESFFAALEIAMKKNIDIKIILPSKRDNKDFILRMNRSNY
jgi:cardiolipin synthase